MTKHENNTLLFELFLQPKVFADFFHLNLKKILAGFLVFLSRFIKIMPNFSAVGSFGFFQSNPVVFFIQIIAFDLFVSGLYPGFLFTYLGFASYWVLGRLAGKNTKKQLLLLPVASFLFFLLSNLGVWWFWYPQNLTGLTTCYTLALPFYRNTLLGDVFFGGVLIGLIKILPFLHAMIGEQKYVT